MFLNLQGLIDNMAALIQIMACAEPGRQAIIRTNDGMLYSLNDGMFYSLNVLSQWVLEDFRKSKTSDATCKCHT